jgi:4-hydroxybenzoate polyprenyltransferase
MNSRDTHRVGALHSENTFLLHNIVMQSAQAVPMATRPSAIFRLLRPRQWVKNAFVCVGVVFSAEPLDMKRLQAVALAVTAFSLMGSSVYVLNDYLDRTSDRAHPTKRNRPLASGAVTPMQGFAAALICLAVATLAARLADPRVLAIVLLYLAINCAYSLRLKHQAVLDVFCIASGFMLRILAGTWGIHIPPSGWLILTGMFLTLFLGFAKRRAEWTDAAGSHLRRRVLGLYSQQLLDTFLSITATGTALCYGLYTLDPQTIALHHTDKLIYTVPFVLFALFRYLFILHSGKKGENPASDVFTDGPIAASGAAFAGCAVWLMYR